MARILPENDFCSTQSSRFSLKTPKEKGALSQWLFKFDGYIQLKAKKLSWIPQRVRVGS